MNQERALQVAEYFCGKAHAEKFAPIIREKLKLYQIPDQRIAFERFLDGEEYGISTNIADIITMGYGTLDQNGFWEFELPYEFVFEFLCTGNLEKYKLSAEYILDIVSKK